MMCCRSCGNSRVHSTPSSESSKSYNPAGYKFAITKGADQKIGQNA